MLPKAADGITNSVQPDQTAFKRIGTVSFNLSVPVHRNFMVSFGIVKPIGQHAREGPKLLA